MTILLSMLLKPFFAVVYFLATFFICHLIWLWMPDSKLKRRLFKPLGDSKQRSWWS